MDALAKLKPGVIRYQGGCFQTSMIGETVSGRVKTSDCVNFWADTATGSR